MPRSSLLVVVMFLALPCRANDVSFSRDILPILSDRCFSCHGPDESHRKAGLRLDLREPATVVKDGVAAIVPGKADASEIIRRIVSDDADEVMPPPKLRKPVTAEQLATLRKWIDAGAPWGKHWSFEKPVRPAVPDAGQKHPIDAFVVDRLKREGLAMAPQAARATLARRAAFDLTGLPPTPELLEAFVKDERPDAYERYVDGLLASEHFGERMAMWWLDAARFSDTDGFQADATRTNWPWRDWVISAFNRNQRFDQFTIEQFAGDLLPNATAEQKLATAFHRNHMTNGEGGRDPEESRVDYVIDRVNTTGTVWLGLTLGCAQCHTHKFDPISHADYYSLSAFFNSIDEDGKAGGGAKPYLSYKSPLAPRAVDEAQQLVDERSKVEQLARKAAEEPFDRWLTAAIVKTPADYNAWRPITVAELESIEGTELSRGPQESILAAGPNPKQDDYRVIARSPLPRITGLKLEVFPRDGGGYARGGVRDYILTDIKVQVRRRNSSQIRDIPIAAAIADYSADPKKHGGYGAVKDVLDDDPRNGWSSKDADATQVRTAVFELAEPLVLAADEELVFEMRHRSTLGDASIERFRVSATDQAGPAVKSVGVAPLEELATTGLSVKPEASTVVPAKLRDRLRETFLADHAPYVVAADSLGIARRQLAEALNGAGVVKVMVLSERETPRETNILVRGVWDKKGEKVSAGVPAAIAEWPAAATRNRLDLAKWITSSDNPLTARVIVNHLWQLCFGAGLVRTPDDFGLQGERPTHPELLDWLAVEFQSDWDVKRLMKLIVTSQTYCQSSDVTAELMSRDPENRLLARGARYRLASWMIRDGALASAGLLNRAVGGPPVRPYQPEGVWEEMFMGRFKYEPSEGAAQHRRTIYAFWRRAIAPTFLFDSAQRRVCEVRANRTNTPLQALTLLNDASYLEASRELAQIALRQSDDPAARVSTIFKRVLCRAPTAAESQIVLKQVERATAYYAANPADAAKLLAIGQKPADAKLPANELAANMLAASMILNLDEAITHE